MGNEKSDSDEGAGGPDQNHNTKSPQSPAGYHSPERKKGISSTVDFIKRYHHAIGLGLLLALVSYLLLPIGFTDIADTVRSLSEGQFLWMILILFIGLFGITAATIEIHERIHKWVYEFFGYETTIERGLLVAVTYVENQWVERNHALISKISPLLILSGSSYFVCIISPNQLLTIVFGLVFLLNTVSSGHDIVSLFSVMKRPPRTLAYLQHENGIRYTYISEPKT